MHSMSEKGSLYLKWQTKSFRFYLSARLLFNNTQYFTAAFCGSHSIECLIKGTLQYWIPDFEPKKRGHNIEETLELLNSSIHGAEHLSLPERLYKDGRYYFSSRYPDTGKHVSVSEFFLEDLDIAYYEIARLVPYQYNSMIYNVLKKENCDEHRILKENNKMFDSLKTFINKHQE